MANSRFEYHKKYEERAERYLGEEFYTVIRIRGYEFEKFLLDHNVSLSLDRRLSDLMVTSAKQLIKNYKGHIMFAYGFGKEFNFLVQPRSQLYSRRLVKIASMFTSVFVSHFNSNWSRFFNDSSRLPATKLKYDALFSAQSYQNLGPRSLIGLMRARQIDCLSHVNSEGMTNRLADRPHGTVIVDLQKDYNGRNPDSDSIKELDPDFATKDTFWYEHPHIFEDFDRIDLNGSRMPEHDGLQFRDENYVIFRIDGDKFHNFSDAHNFHKPNDKRALDLMVAAAKQVILFFQGDIPLAYGQSDEFSFLMKSSSAVPSRDIIQITSILSAIFTASYNRLWTEYFEDPSQGDVTNMHHPAWFDGKAKEYPNYLSVINYFKWRQVDCHINNLYNTTLHALSGKYMRHELEQSDQEPSTWSLRKTPISNFIDKSQFISAKEATARLSGTVSSDKHEILFKQFHINYNNEIEQFKKGTTLLYIPEQSASANQGLGEVHVHHVDMTRKETFWLDNMHMFKDAKKV